MEHTTPTNAEPVDNLDPTISHGDKPPADPSNTSHIGQRVEQGVLSKKEGITEQSSDWEDKPQRDTTGESLIDPAADKYVKSPSPEENGE